MIWAIACCAGPGAVLAMIALTSRFWGPKAIAILGGLTVATMLRFVFMPALYAAWLKVRRTAEPTLAPAPAAA